MTGAIFAALSLLCCLLAIAVQVLRFWADPTPSTKQLRKAERDQRIRELEWELFGFASDGSRQPPPPPPPPVRRIEPDHLIKASRLWLGPDPIAEAIGWAGAGSGGGAGGAAITRLNAPHGAGGAGGSGHVLLVLSDAGGDVVRLPRERIEATTSTEIRK